MNKKNEELSSRLEKCYSGAVHDVMRARGDRPRVLPSAIQPLNPAQRLAGNVFTVPGHYEEGLDEHDTLIRWTEMLTEVPEGCVIVCQPNDDRVSHMGELSAETLQFRGIRGYVVDGGCRDTEFILNIGFKVFCRYFTPRDVVGCWIPDQLGEPVRIGDVTINTGEWLVADRDGIVVVRADEVDEVVEATEEVMQKESLVRNAILEGTSPKDAYLEYGKF